LRDDEMVSLALDDSGAVSIAGEAIGKLEGFRFTPDARAEGIHGRTLRSAAFKGLEGEFHARAQRLSRATDAQIALSEHGKLWWDGAVVATLDAGASALAPRVMLHADEQLRGDLRTQIQARLDDWLTARIATRLEPLIALRAAVEAKPGSKEALPAQARGLAHQLCETLGSLDRGSALLPPDERAAMRSLRPHGVRFARRSVYLPKLIRPDAAALLALLWAVKHRLEKIPPPPPAGLTSFEAEPETPPGFIAAAGFRTVGPRAIRIDMLDRLEQELESAAASGTTADAAIPKLVSLLGSDRATLETVLADLGWSRVEVANAPTSVWRHGAPQPRRRGRAKHRRVVTNPNSPFAGLELLKLK
jgi:ATP-dependent RNA helicase SUPV3L1/SUV3